MRRTFSLLSRGPSQQISGGYLYNRYLMDYLARNGYGVRYYGEAPDLAELEQADVIVVDGLVALAHAGYLSRLSRPVVIVLHEAPAYASADSARIAAFRKLCASARLVVTGDATLDRIGSLVRPGSAPAVKIEPGVPRSWQAKTGYAPTARKLLSIANYIPGKGVGRVLAVLASLRNRDWSMVVHGNRDLYPGYHDELLARVAKLGLTGRVQLLGTVPHSQVNALMTDADLLVHLSRHESYSMVTAEAIVCGLPVLSTRTGNWKSFSASRLVQHIDPYSNERAAGLLEQLLENPGAYGALRRIGGWRSRTCEDVGREFVDCLQG